MCSAFCLHLASRYPGRPTSCGENRRKIKGRDYLLECMKSKGRWYLLIEEKDFFLKNKIDKTEGVNVIYQERDHMLLTNKEVGK